MNQVFTSKNNKIVHVDLENSHAATHIEKNPILLKLIEKYIPTVDLVKDEERIEINTGEVIGLSDLVKLEKGDDTFWAKRKNREKYSYFVKNKQAKDEKFFVMRFNNRGDNSYDLYTTYIGTLTPSFPEGKEDTDEEARVFWSKNALVFGRQEIDESTITHECPW